MSLNQFILESTHQTCCSPSRIFTLLLFWDAWPEIIHQKQQAATAEGFRLTSECSIYAQQIKTLTRTRQSFSICCSALFWRCALRPLLARVQLFLWECANVTAGLMMTVFCHAEGRAEMLRLGVRESATCQSLLLPLRAVCQQSFDALNPHSYCFLYATELKAL